MKTSLGPIISKPFCEVFQVFRLNGAFLANRLIALKAPRYFQHYPVAKSDFTALPA